MSDWEKIFEKVNKENKALFLLKNEQYGSAFESLGIKGLFVMIWGDANKLRVNLWEKSSPAVTEEKLKDILRDISITANMALMLMESDLNET